MRGFLDNKPISYVTSTLFARFSHVSCSRHFRMESTGNTSGNGEHLHRTQHDFRQNNITPAVVSTITQISDTVKGLTLKVTDDNCSFKAGQWVDFFIPGIEIFTGYSMCSSPKTLSQTGELNLAVKISDYPPTEWVHAECQVDSKVSIRVGGSFYYDPQPDEPTSDVLLIAGGVGINPLYAMLLHVADLHAAYANGENVHQPGKVTLLYSARSLGELIFRDDILHLCQTTPNMQCEFFTTKEMKTPSNIPNLSACRINKSHVETTLAAMDKKTVKCCICGPAPMINCMEEILHSLGIHESQIAYEKWW